MQYTIISTNVLIQFIIVVKFYIRWTRMSHPSQSYSHSASDVVQKGHRWPAQSVPLHSASAVYKEWIKMHRYTRCMYIYHFLLNIEQTEISNIYHRTLRKHYCEISVQKLKHWAIEGTGTDWLADDIFSFGLNCATKLPHSTGYIWEPKLVSPIQKQECTKQPNILLISSSTVCASTF